MKKVIHLIPYDGIGGVEIAARSMANITLGDIEFIVEYIYRPVDAQIKRVATFNPLPIINATRRILAHKPELLIISLWRPCIVSIFVKILRPRLKLVLFLHSPKDVHWIDRFLTRCTAKLAQQIWADSDETLTQRLPVTPLGKGRVISFIAHRIPAIERTVVSSVFIFWGRIHPHKGLDRALGIFKSVRAKYPAAHFIIIGPDGGELKRIKRLVNEMGLNDDVSLLGGLDFTEIVQLACKASFYLQTSLLEGMAMSVVEAMQLGLVPVVTPVGEIGNYCRHGYNALIVQSDEEVVREILEVLNDNSIYWMLRNNVLATWAEKPLYAESVFRACREILSNNPESSARLA